MSYNRELRADAQARLDTAAKRSSSSSSNPEIIEARADIDELDATHKKLEEERDELWTRYKRACNDAMIPKANIRINEEVLMNQVYDGDDNHQETKEAAC